MTKAAKVWGKRVAKFLELPSTREYIEALEASVRESDLKPLVITQRGNGNLPTVGTWGHPKLAVRFAQWLAVRFASYPCSRGSTPTHRRANARMDETLDLDQAAALLHMHKETVRQRAKAGELPGAKLGRRWVFLLEDLKNYLRAQYPAKRQAVQVPNLEEYTWHCTDAATPTGLPSRTQVGSAYAEALGLQS